MIELVAYGRPAPQGSKRSVGRGRFQEASPFLAEWRKALVLSARTAMEAGRHETMARPVSVSLVVTVARPDRSMYEWPAGPPDLDKLQRAVGDALTIAGVIKDDALIVEWLAAKCYPGQSPRSLMRPGAWIRVHEIEP